MKKIIVTMLAVVILTTVAQADPPGGYVIYTSPYRSQDPVELIEPIQTINFLGNSDESETWELVTTNGYKITNIYSSHEDAEDQLDEIRSGESIRVSNCEAMVETKDGKGLKKKSDEVFYRIEYNLCKRKTITPLVDTDDLEEEAHKEINYIKTPKIIIGVIDRSPIPFK